MNSKLAKHRDEIEELNNVRSLLKTLQSVFDLPARLLSPLSSPAATAREREPAAAGAAAPAAAPALDDDAWFEGF